MKKFRQFFNFSFFVIYIFLGWFFAVSVYGESVPKKASSKSMATEPAGHKLVGIVVDEMHQFSPDTFSKLATAKSFDEFFRMLGGLTIQSKPAANVIVTIKGVTITNTIVTDSEGNFSFTGLPSERYEISAEMPSRCWVTGEKRMATARIPFEFGYGLNRVRLKLRTDWVSVKGRITNTEGQPIAGAKVCGEPYADLDHARAMSYPTRYAISGSDGSYELRDMAPPDITKIAAYLNGRNPSSFSQDPFYVSIHVKADGYIQDIKDVPHVPLITKELLGPARRFDEITTPFKALEDSNSTNKIERKHLPLPASQSNTITGIDIVLKKAESDMR